MINRASVEHSYLSARQVRPLKGFNAAEYRSLHKIGINMNDRDVRKLMQGQAAMDAMAMDSIQPTVTTGSVGTPVQFLQNWLPGFVFVITAARKIDDLIGLMVTGAWEDEQIVQGI